jgi:hypothetical protein
MQPTAQAVGTRREEEIAPKGRKRDHERITPAAADSAKTGVFWAKATTPAKAAAISRFSPSPD